MKHPPSAADGLGPPPPLARALFPSERFDQVVRYAELLATEGVVRGLLGPREVSRVWDRHLVNCALVAAALPRSATVADVGSGAGLPGVVLALARPDVQVVLVEPLLRRSTFLEEVTRELGLDHVEVRRERAEALHGERRFDVVTARAVAPLERLARWCMPLVAPQGALLALKGRSAEAEIVDARATLRRLGCAEPTIEVLTPERGRPDPEDATEGPDDGDAQTRVVRVTWGDPARVSLRTSAHRRGARPGGRPGRPTQERKPK